VTKAQFEREKNFQVALAVARAMLTQGIIDDGDLDRIQRVLRIKFCPLTGALTLDA